MKTSRLILFGVIAVLAGVSCRRDPIYENVSKYRFDFDIDTSVLYGRGSDPDLIQLIFYDPSTGKKVTESYMDPEGGYLYGVASGTYDIVAFTMGSQRTDITYTKDFSLLTAETKLLQSSPETVVLSPDHVWVCVKKGTVIPYLSVADPDFCLRLPLVSLCDSWKVTVTGIKGLRYAVTSHLFLSSQTKDILLKDMTREGPCSIRAEGTASADTTLLEIPFCTFGMPETGSVKATLVIEALDGQKHTGVFDITSQVRDSANVAHSISFDFPVELLPPIQGGLDPSTDEWEEHREQIDIQ